MKPILRRRIARLANIMVNRGAENIATTVTGEANTSHRRIAVGVSRMSKYAEDKERVDKITELIANQKPVKEWVCIYWLAVAVGHLLEWVVKHEKHIS